MPVPKPPATKAPKGHHTRKIVKGKTSSIYDDNIGPTTQILTPKGYCQLTDKQKEEDVPRVISWSDPSQPLCKVRYSYSDKQFQAETPFVLDGLSIHLSVDGVFIPKDSDEAKEQMERDKEKKREEKERVDKIMEEHKDEEGINIDDLLITRNQFNYSDRAAQTFTTPMREKFVTTKPPPRVNFGGSLSKWKIYDDYLSEYEIQEGHAAKNAVSVTTDVMHAESMGYTLKILERIVNQNREDDIYQDATFWEDAADSYRTDGKGSLLPLWCFCSERSKKKQVTALLFHPKFPDMFAVGFGSYDFLEQNSGLIYIYSLKNTSHPEYTFSTESGVTCLDFHPQHPSLLAVGCYDGSVRVFDVQLKSNKPIYSSSIKNGTHSDPVWEVKWQEEDVAKEHNFYSVSGDGIIANWIMTNTELKMEPVMSLKLPTATVKEQPEEGAALTGLASGLCFDFHKTSEHMFIVGTEEGKIHKCSKAYSGQYLETYEGHHMAIYTVKWNPYHPRVFLSCSADWTVSIWDHRINEPIMTFDLGEEVGDVAWSPYSATVFCAVTSKGMVHLYDLTVNKHDPICSQKVVKKAKLTHVCFNQRDPIILVGDDHGRTMTLKLSPNLRNLYPYKESSTKDDTEIDRMDRLLTAALDAMAP